MSLHETIFCATSPPSPGSGSGAISIHDFQSGATLASFKQTSAGPRCTALFESRSTAGGFVLAAQPDKSILNVYNFQKDQLHLKIVLPEKLSCVAVDRRGDLCAGGTSQGRIYIWEISSGILYNSWDAHYRQVNVLRFTDDCEALVSGSDDSGVSVWSVSRLLDDELQNELPTPYCSLSDHTLPITDITCGVGPFPKCRILTSSFDHSVKLWDLASKSLLVTFMFPQPISHLAWDSAERLFFAASPEGSIHQINLYRESKSKFGGVIAEALGGSGPSEIIRFDNNNAENAKKRLLSVGSPISSVAISITTSTLLVGTVEGLIHLYDIPSHQLLRTISTHRGFSISTLVTMLKPPDLVGHTSLEYRVGNDTKDITPPKPVVPFHRLRDTKARDLHEVSMLLTSQSLTNHSQLYNCTSYTTEELLRDYATFIHPPLSAHKSGSNSASLEVRLHELEYEVEHLKEQLGKAKGVNDTMWDTVVKRLVGQGVGQQVHDAVDVDDREEEQRRRKRSRF